MNISSIHNCYGCGLCATVCGKGIIEIGFNSDGFYEPRITCAEKCTDCGLCVDVCSYCNEDLALQQSELHSFATWSKDPSIRYKCSSGGIGFELGRMALQQGYKVCAVRFDAGKNRAEHYIAATEEELLPSIGSKYIQSYTVDGFKAIRRKEKYLVTGTPCQIDSFRRYIQKFKLEDNFILMDFFCHGVPSMWLWKKYTAEIEKRIGNILSASWRNKSTGWHDSWSMTIEGEGQNLGTDSKACYTSRLSQGDVFYKLFLSDVCLGKACYEKCKFKYDKSSADIRIGDMWGKTYKDNEEGVSAVVTFTEKGLNALKLCGCEWIEQPFELVAEGQMKSSPVQPYSYEMCRHLLNNPSVSLTVVYTEYMKSLKRQQLIRRLKNPFRSGINLLKRLRIWK